MEKQTEKAMDLRVPSGLFFLLTGGVLVAMGLISNPQAPMTAPGSNVDLHAGGAMLCFGVILLALAMRGRE